MAAPAPASAIAASASLPPLSGDPRRVGKVVDLLARGVRTSRGLQEALGLDASDVDRALASAGWLGLVDLTGEAMLTDAGLTYAYAHPGAPRARQWARLVRQHPFVQGLLRGPPPTLAPVGEVATALKEAGLDEVSARQRAAAIRDLCAPAFGRRAAPEPTQLALPLASRGAEDRPPTATLGSAREFDPDLLRYVLTALTDHGELSLGEVRALLDRSGVAEAPIGGYIDLLMSRGDACRLEERLVITPSGASRRALCETTPSVVLSDPGWRGYLTDWLAAASGDRAAEIRRDQKRPRFRLWDRRLFGGAVAPEAVEAALRKVLLDRSLDAFPVATPGGATPRPPRGSFLDNWTRNDLVIALPPPLEALRRGLATVNHALKTARLSNDAVALPGLAHRPTLVFGGLLAPGETPPRTVPDVRSLRARLLSNAPYAALTASLLLLHRRDPSRHALRWRRGGYALAVGEHHVDLLDLLDGFASSRGWSISRRPRSGLGSGGWVASLEAVGVITVVGDLAVLGERLFAQMRQDPEERAVYDAVLPLSEALAAWLER